MVILRSHHFRFDISTCQPETDIAGGLYHMLLWHSVSCHLHISKTAGGRLPYRKVLLHFRTMHDDDISVSQSHREYHGRGSDLFGVVFVHFLAPFFEFVLREDGVQSIECFALLLQCRSWKNWLFRIITVALGSALVVPFFHLQGHHRRASKR